jgi:hypothetical protein
MLPDIVTTYTEHIDLNEYDFPVHTFDLLTVNVISGEHNDIVISTAAILTDVNNLKTIRIDMSVPAILETDDVIYKLGRALWNMSTWLIKICEIDDLKDLPRKIETGDLSKEEQHFATILQDRLIVSDSFNIVPMKNNVCKIVFAKDSGIGDLIMFSEQLYLTYICQFCRMFDQRFLNIMSLTTEP